MIEHALGVLEFERVLERVAGRATSDVGRRQILALRPSYDVDEIERELERVASCMSLFDASPQWTPVPIPDLEEVLTQLVRLVPCSNRSIYSGWELPSRRVLGLHDIWTVWRKTFPR